MANSELSSTTWNSIGSNIPFIEQCFEGSTRRYSNANHCRLDFRIMQFTLSRTKDVAILVSISVLMFLEHMILLENNYFFTAVWSTRSHAYKGDSNYSALFTPLTFLVTYFNSGVNPLLYAFLSRNFRKGMRELILCTFKKGKNKSSQQRIPLHVSKSLFWRQDVLTTMDKWFIVICTL